MTYPLTPTDLESYTSNLTEIFAYATGLFQPLYLQQKNQG